jgi:hypothetical protein
MNFIVLFVLSFSLGSWATTRTQALEINKISPVNLPIEMSGLTRWQGHFLTVSDNLSDHYLYKLEENKKGHNVLKLKNMYELDGFKTYFLKKAASFKFPLDLEGIYSCGKKLYLANERARSIFTIEDNKVTEIEIDMPKLFKQFKINYYDISSNAGLEGVAVDCKNNILFMAQERQPRGIFVFNLETKKAIRFIDFAPYYESKKINPDFADIFFEGEHLYALERNHRVIAKINPVTGALVSRIGYGFLKDFPLRDLYKKDHPYGLAEGLYMTKGQIIIAIDNNGAEISEKAKGHFNLEGNNGVLLYFKRPTGF